ncbi:hypothetical protein ON010_g17009 [Phytophthora cinnamomi]|nr:hypothetical protein ON010_g17009 [Phytophthora cinnamomi]
MYLSARTPSITVFSPLIVSVQAREATLLQHGQAVKLNSSSSNNSHGPPTATAAAAAAGARRRGELEGLPQAAGEGHARADRGRDQRQGQRVRGLLPQARAAHGHLREGLRAAVPHPGGGRPHHPGGPQRDGPRQERHGQDGRLHHPVPREDGHEQEAHPGADPRPHARAGAADVGHRQGDRQAHGRRVHGVHGRHESQGRHHASLPDGAHSSGHPGPRHGPGQQGSGRPQPVLHGHHGRGRQAAVPRVPAAAGAAPEPHGQATPDLPLLGHVPRHGQGVQGPVRGEPVRDQPHGRAHAQGRLPVLRLRGGAAEGALPQHALLQARHQPVHHLLQLGEPRRAAGQEGDGARLLVLLHPRQDEPGAPQPRVPRVPQRRHAPPRVLRPVHARYRHPDGERRDQLRLPEKLRDVPAPHRSLRSVRPPRSGHQYDHVRGPIQPVPHRAGARHGDPTDPAGHRPQPVLQYGDVERAGKVCHKAEVERPRATALPAAAGRVPRDGNAQLRPI